MYPCPYVRRGMPSLPQGEVAVKLAMDNKAKKQHMLGLFGHASKYPKQDDKKKGPTNRDDDKWR